MNELATIAGLLSLRRRRERSALEAVTAQTQRLRAAEHAVAVAAEMLQQHDLLADERERALLAPLISQPVPQPRIARMRGALDALAVDRTRLEAAQNAAKAARQKQVAALDVARALFSARRRATTKLDGLYARAAARRALREEAVAEGEQEPRGARLGVPSDTAPGARKI